VLDDARGEDARGAAALSQIADGFAEGRPDVALGLCRQGLRRFPSDARFPLCLARVSSSLGRVGDTADYYAMTLRLEGAELEAFDEALATFGAMIADGAFARTEDVGEVRTAGRAAHELISLRTLRFPSAEPGPLDQPTLHLALARAELTNGRAEQARREFEESISEGRRMPRTPPAAVTARRELAALELRAGSPDAARALLEDALDLVSQGREADQARAELHAGIGDTWRVAGHAEQAQRAYRQGLALLEGLGDAGQAEERARRALARGILLRRLGELDRSRAAFEEAIGAAPTPENAAEILQHLVTEAPDAELWVEAVRALAEAPVSEEASRVLGAEATRGGWQARLASLARGEIDEAAALAAAEGGSERCEAHFYAAIRSLRAGDRATARRALEASIATGMIGQGEYGMAQELLRGAVR
jgi:tetratricopeptide (TPR) repeat protein